VLVLEPSPKVQKWLVIVPVELSVKLTANGAPPEVGLATKLAVSGIVPIPVSVLVEVPAFAVTQLK